MASYLNFPMGTPIIQAMILLPSGIREISQLIPQKKLVLLGLKLLLQEVSVTKMPIKVLKLTVIMETNSDSFCQTSTMQRFLGNKI